MPTGNIISSWQQHPCSARDRVASRSWRSSSARIGVSAYRIVGLDNTVGRVGLREHAGRGAGGHHRGIGSADHRLPASEKGFDGSGSALVVRPF